MSNYNLESFCPEVWSQMMITSTGDYRGCCLANYSDDNSVALDENKQPMNIMTHTWDQAINSTTHKEHRLMLSRNEKPLKCVSCYDSEEATGKPSSKRQRVIRITAASIPQYVRVDQAAELTAPDGSIDQKIVNLDLRFGNLCNQKCIMCSPEYSSAWYDDWLDVRPHNKFFPSEYKSYEILKDEHGRAYSNFPNWWESDIWWQRFDEIAPQLRYIYFSGGEPFVVPAMLETLDKLIERGFAKRIQLRYDTNLSVINDKIIDKLKHFKRVMIMASIDDTEQRYELIRFPGNYQRLLSNIEKLRSRGIELHFMTACIGVASPYTVLRIDKLSKQLNIPRKYRFLEGPPWIDIRQFPKSAKQEIIQRYKSAIVEGEDNTWKNAVIRLLEKYIDHSDTSQLQEFVRVMNILDRNRGTDWKSTLDETYQLISTHCPEIDLNKSDNFKYGPK